MSLDMDALQSTGKEAVNAAIVAAQSVAELIARFYAEQVMKPLFRGLLPLIAHPKSQGRIVRLRGKYVPMNPAVWDASMDVSVNVALGSMNTDKKIAVMMQVVQDQTQILTEYGPQNPVVTLAMLRNAKAKILSMQGVKDVESYYMQVPPDWQPPPPPPPEPTPDELWIQAEKEMAFQKSMKELAIKQDELELAKEKLVVESRLKEQELAIRENEHAHGLREEADVQKYKADLDAQMKMAEIESKERIEREKMAIEREKMLLDAEAKRYVADTQAATAQFATQTGAETAKTAASAKQKAEAGKVAAKQKPVQVVVEQPDLSKLAEAVADLKNNPPVVNVPAPVVNIAAPEQKKKGRRKGKITGPDGQTYTVETED
jgi:hypothetical protein